MEVYVLHLDTLRPRLEEALGLLSPLRREKALRRRSETPRLQSVGAGLLLRRFFGPEDPAVLPGGKPYYPGKQPFSLTHSGELAAIALAESDVGLDAQAVAPVSEAVKRRVLDERELAWLREQGPEGFAFLWTRKEAALKCLGTGVDRPLASVNVLPGGPLQLDGRALELHSVRFENYMLSAASEKDAVFTPRVLTAEELLRMI